MTRPRFIFSRLGLLELHQSGTREERKADSACATVVVGVRVALADGAEESCEECAVEAHITPCGFADSQLAGRTESFELLPKIDPVTHLGIGEKVFLTEFARKGLRFALGLVMKPAPETDDRGEVGVGGQVTRMAFVSFSLFLKGTSTRIIALQ